MTVPAAPVAVAATVSVQGCFTDPGTHTATWTWDDGTTSAGVVSESAGHGTVTGSHVYTAAGVYTITLTVTDSGGASGQRVSPFLVVYDPAGGFVTGGGSFNSPAGAYVANPSLTGQASFGFVSKYKKNVTPPTGETEFHFSDLNFHSGTYDWLVITGAKAQCQGTGTINNAGNFGFKLTVIDGQVIGRRRHGQDPDQDLGQERRQRHRLRQPDGSLGQRQSHRRHRQRKHRHPLTADRIERGASS